ncbi:phage recombination protein Bet [Escherichia coli]|nr:phage recombination protein Bet [Escherichia coli]MDY9479911.1 phage recombination protein Bet [Escherichia coli]
MFFIDAQFIALLIVANQYGLNPWTKEIYAFPDKQNGIVPVVGVDGWSRIINENQQFDGMDFEQDNESCTCRIYRKDRNHPICVTEWMDECRREPFKTREGREITGPWQSHPKRMLRHKAMIQCARLAFGFAGTSRDFMKFRLGGFEAIKSAYMAQVQYSMWVTRKDAWYFANYDPRMKREGLHYVVIERDEKYMASFDEMVPEFIEKMDEALAEIGFVFGEQWR